MTTSGQGRVLWHGTTRQRAASIIKNGPTVGYTEPGGLIPEFEFTTAPAGLPEHQCLHGHPKTFARMKAANFSMEGGPVILEIEVPPEVACQAQDAGVELLFGPGYGLDELLQAWPQVRKTIRELHDV